MAKGIFIHVICFYKCLYTLSPEWNCSLFLDVILKCICILIHNLSSHWCLFVAIQLPISQHWVITRTTRTPAFWGYPPPPHDYPYYWVILDPKSKEDKVKVTNLKNLPKLQIFEFWNNLYTRHTFWSCLIRPANIKWIRQVLLKIQSGHDSVHRRTRWYKYTTPFNFVEAGGIMIRSSTGDKPSPEAVWWLHQMETFTGHRWIPPTKASDAELWCFLWSAPEQMVE